MPVPATTFGLHTETAAQWTQKTYATALLLSALLTAALLHRFAPCRFRHLLISPS